MTSMFAKTITAVFLIFYSKTIDCAFTDGNGNFIVSTWLEVGYVTVKSDEFTSATGKVKTFKSPGVFISVPDHGSENLNSGYQSCTRIRDVTNTTLNPGPISFQVRTVQPNDTWCNYTWWTPIIEPSQSLRYLIMEEGHYNLSGAEFDVGFAVIGQHCKAQSHRYFFGTPFRLGTKPASFAHYQTYSDPRFVAFRGLADANNILAITLYIQLHNFDHKWHPRLGDCVAGHYDDHYDNNHWRQAYTFAPELLAVVGYTPDYAASCLEGIAFETHYIYGITSDPRFIPFYWLYDKIPGVFGMVNSFVGGDDITVRSFNHSTVGVGVIAQESQCDKGSFIHIQAETQSFFIIGPNKLQSVVLSNPYTTLKAVQGKCEVGYCDQDDTCYGSSAFVESLTGVPTGIPTAIPTHVPSPLPTYDPDPTGMPTPFPMF